MLFRRHLFVHLGADEGAAKWDLVVVMLQKLYALGAGRIKEDNPDSLVNQEVLLPGHLWNMITKEKLGDYLATLKSVAEADFIRAGWRPREAAQDVGALALPSFTDPKWWKSTMDRAGSKADVGRKLEYVAACVATHL
jgi:DNA-directed RNA polymerase I subunit RPA2